MSESLSVLQWNIWYSEAIEHIGAFLLANKADVICLQELTIDHPAQAEPNTPEYIAQLLGYNYFHRELPIEDTDGNQSMIANGIFSKYPIIDSRFVYINEPKNQGGYSDEYRAYVEVVLDVAGKPVTVGTAHSSYTHRFEPNPGKQAEADSLIAELRKPTRNFIFAGDLNTLPDSSMIAAIGGVLNSAGPDFAQKTWTTKPFSYNGFTATTLDWRLDYVFTTPDVTVTSAEIMPTDYSDHLPILAKVELS